MNFSRYLFILLPLLCGHQHCFSQTKLPKRELRAVWIATVANIDWPSRKDLSPVVQQEEYRYILAEQKKNGMNAVVVQVRPAADAFYRKSREPWSMWLTGKQGQAPNPPYDPLEFMVDESHRHGMEFHAWFNPYRATFDTVAGNIAPDHITQTRPELFLTYGGKKLFNPGLPEVRAYITQVILDVVRGYDVDAVHFDDYFYPYAIAGDTLRDDNDFQMYGAGFTNKNDWRRHNVNLLIQMVSDSLKGVKPWVKFGISPFGVWRNRAEDPTGSDTRGGQTSYTHLYADSRGWLERGWIDYIVPQIYFSTGHKQVNYASLLDWWTKNSFGRHLYVGQGTYKVARDRDSAWFDPTQTGAQIRLNRTYPQVHGSMFFSSKSVMRNPLAVQDSLRSSLYAAPALVPVMAWKDSIPPRAPASLKVRSDRSGIWLSWKTPPPAADGDTARYYVIYRSEGKSKPDLNNPRHILGTQWMGNEFKDESAGRGKRYQYLVTAVDRLHNESSPTDSERGKGKKR
jgi:uncharacterized lipoprotein YddW (UPF0748 family)